MSVSIARVLHLTFARGSRARLDEMHSNRFVARWQKIRLGFAFSVSAAFIVGVQGAHTNENDAPDSFVASNLMSQAKQIGDTYFYGIPQFHSTRRLGRGDRAVAERDSWIRISHKVCPLKWHNVVRDQLATWQGKGFTLADLEMYCSRRKTWRVSIVGGKYPVIIKICELTTFRALICHS